MKAIEILTTYDALAFLANKDLDLNTACNIAKNIQSLTIPKQVIDSKQSKLTQELLEKYGEKDEDGNLKTEEGKIKIVDVPSYNTEMMQFLNTEIEEDVELIKIKKSALIDIKISPNLAKGLMDILEE